MNESPENPKFESITSKLAKDFADHNTKEKASRDRLLRVIVIYIIGFNILVVLSFVIYSNFCPKKSQCETRTMNGVYALQPIDIKDTIVKKDIIYETSETIKSYKKIKDNYDLLRFLTSKQQGQGTGPAYRYTEITNNLPTWKALITIEKIYSDKIEFYWYDNVAKKSHNAFITKGYSYVPIHNGGGIFAVLDIDSISKSVVIYGYTSDKSRELDSLKELLKTE